MTVRYTVRMQFGPHQPSAAILKEVLDTCQRGRVDEVMFFAFAEEQNDGHDTLDRIRQWMDAIRPWKQALEAEGIDVSLNPWHSILHEDRYRRLKPDQNWQTLVDWRGRSAQTMVCPLDPDWRTYYAGAMRLFAAEKFRVVWIDDDIRFHNHAPLDWGGCWCPLHVAEFNRRTERTATREEIVAACLRTGEPHPWRDAWFDMWDSLHREMIDGWRKVVEAAGSRLGLMSSSLEAHSAEGRRWQRWWPALAQRFPATHRPHFWGYADASSDMLIYGISQMQQNRIVQPEGVESDPEIENFPYGPWNKSFRQTYAQMALAQTFASDRLAVSLFDFTGNLPSDEPERAAFLARAKPTLAWLGGLFTPSQKPVGIGVPWHQDMSRAVRTDGREDWRALEVGTRAWERILGPLGFAFTKEPDPHINALSGAMAWCFDNKTIRDWLTRGLLIDGPAAAILYERGFGELIGLESAQFIAQEDVLYATEESLDGWFGLREGAQISLNGWMNRQPKLLQGRLHEGTRLISVLRSPTYEKVGYGAYLFQNELRGRVGVVPWDASSGFHLYTARRAQLEKMLTWISRDKSRFSVSGGAWLVPQFFAGPPNHVGIVWNAGPDAVSEFTVQVPRSAGLPTRAAHCDAYGRRKPVPMADGKVILPTPMHQWEFVVLLWGDASIGIEETEDAEELQLPELHPKRERRKPRPTRNLESCFQGRGGPYR